MRHQVLNSEPVQRPNTYEASSGQETPCSCERIVPIFFRRVHAGAVVNRCGVLT